MFLQAVILSMPFLQLLWIHSPTCSFTPAHITGDNCPQGGPSRISISRTLHITTHCNHKDDVIRRRLLLEQECKLHHNVITAQRRTNPTKRKRRKIDNIYVQLISQSWRYWPWNKLIYCEVWRSIRGVAENSARTECCVWYLGEEFTQFRMIIFLQGQAIIADYIVVKY